MNQEESGGLCTNETDTVKVCSKKSKNFLIDSLLANDFQPKSFTSHDSANQEPPFFQEADGEDVQDRDNDSSGMYFVVLKNMPINRIKVWSLWWRLPSHICHHSDTTEETASFNPRFSMAH